MANYQHILYLEDDAIDIKNMQWLSQQIDTIQLHILEDLSEVDTFLQSHTIDLIITDQYVQHSHFSEYISAFKNIPYVVLSNSDLEKSAVLTSQPIIVLSKPLYLSAFEELCIKKEVNSVEQPTDEYFDTITDISMKNEMLKLLTEEFKNAVTQFPKLIAQQQTREARNLIHKLSGKFSLLKMKQAYNSSRNLEKELANGIFNTTKATDLLQKIKQVSTYLDSKFAIHDSTDY